MGWKKLSEGWVPTNGIKCDKGCKRDWRFYMKPGNLIKVVCRKCETQQGFLCKSWLLHSEGC